MNKLISILIIVFLFSMPFVSAGFGFGWTGGQRQVSLNVSVVQINETDPIWTANQSGYYPKADVYNKSEIDDTFDLYALISDLVSYVGNWTLDKPNYYNTTEVYNKTEVDSLIASPFDQDLNTTDNVTFANITGDNFFGFLNWSWITNAPSFLLAETDPVFTSENGTLIHVGNESWITDNVGNWSADMPNYYNKTEVYNKTETYTKAEVDNNFSNYYLLSNPLGYYNSTTIPAYALIADLVSLVGNWSADKSDYYNKTEVDNNFSLYYLLSNPLGYYNSTTLPLETDPVYTGENGTIARTGNCPSGEFVVNTTTGGVECEAPPSFTETDPYWTANQSSYYNKTQVDNNLSNYFLKAGDTITGDLIIDNWANITPAYSYRNNLGDNSHRFNYLYLGATPPTGTSGIYFGDPTDNGYLSFGGSPGSFSLNAYTYISGGLQLTGNNFRMPTAGTGIELKEGGTSAYMGNATLVGGTVVVVTDSVGTDSRIFITTQSPGGTVGSPYVSSRNDKRNFTITSTSGTDTSTVAWLIIKPV